MGEYHLTGPLSMRKHPLKPELDASVRATVHAALVAEAERLHEQAAAGFDPSAYKLKASRHVAHLYSAGEAGVILCVWVWLSNGRKARAAWLIRSTDGPVTGCYERVAWPLKGSTSKRPSAGVRGRSGATGK